MQAEFAETVVDELVATEPTQVENARFIIYIKVMYLKDIFLQKKT